MPEEISGVIDYLRSGASNATAATTLTLHGDPAHGMTLFVNNCAGCHGMRGRGGIAPEIGNPVFQTSATDDVLVRTIRGGRIGTAMPAFQRSEAPDVSDQDSADVVAYLRTFVSPERQKAIAMNDTASGGKL